MRKRSRLAGKGKAVTARLALRLHDSLAGRTPTCRRAGHRHARAPATRAQRRLPPRRPLTPATTSTQPGAGKPERPAPGPDPTTKEEHHDYPDRHPGLVSTNGLEIYVEQVGDGPDVLLIGGLGDTVESWQFQLDGLADRYRLTAFDNRGAGRTAMPDGPAHRGDDGRRRRRRPAGARHPPAHVAGFSGGSIIAQELALRHPKLVRSLVLQSTWPAPDPYLRTWGQFVRWLVEAAPSERAFLEGFFLDIYTARAHNDGTVDQIIEEALAFPHKQCDRGPTALPRRLHRPRHDRPPAPDRRADARARRRPRPTSRPELCRAVAELIPGARFEVMEDESHQPFQEVPDEWNARVDAFWREVEADD